MYTSVHFTYGFAFLDVGSFCYTGQIGWDICCVAAFQHGFLVFSIAVFGDKVIIFTVTSRFISRALDRNGIIITVFINRFVNRAVERNMIITNLGFT